MPVVVGFYDEADAYAPNASDDFFKRLAETSPTPGKPFYMPNGTPFFCSADGMLLPNGLADWRRVPSSSRKPGAVVVPERTVDPERVKNNRRLTKPPMNTLILRTYVRGLKRDKQGSLYAPRIIDWEHGIKVPAEPNRDFLWLRQAEWLSLLPQNPAKGDRFPVTDTVRDRICHWHIAGGYHGLPGRYTQDDFRFKEMTLVVEEVTPQSVSMRLHGSAAVKQGATYAFHGLLRYDPGKRAFSRFDVLALCDEGHDLEPESNNAPSPRPHRHYGVALELSGERSDDLLPPFWLREGSGPEKYFANAR